MTRERLTYGIDTFTGRVAHMFFNMGWDTWDIAGHLNVRATGDQLYTEADIYNHMPAVHELRRRLRGAA